MSIACAPSGLRTTSISSTFFCGRLLRQCFFFFFSSRRRHTRSDRDWSSDVCSSDLYEQWGEGLLERLNGQFAFALHDRRTASLFLARDRFGILPLYYAERGGDLYFEIGRAHV